MVSTASLWADEMQTEIRGGLGADFILGCATYSSLDKNISAFILHISILSKILTKKVQSNLIDVLYIGQCYVLGIVTGALE